MVSGRRKHAPSRLERWSRWTLVNVFGIRSTKKARTRVARSEGAKRGWETRRARAARVGGERTDEVRS